MSQLSRVNLCRELVVAGSPVFLVWRVSWRHCEIVSATSLFEHRNDHDVPSFQNFHIQGSADMPGLQPYSVWPNLACQDKYSTATRGVRQSLTAAAAAADCSTALDVPDFNGQVKIGPDIHSSTANASLPAPTTKAGRWRIPTYLSESATVKPQLPPSPRSSDHTERTSSRAPAQRIFIPTFMQRPSMQAYSTDVEQQTSQTTTNVFPSRAMGCTPSDSTTAANRDPPPRQCHSASLRPLVR
jgi:hypothetical protein